jgi:hypothetical protein
VIELVFKDHTVSIGERRHHAKIGHVAGGKQQRTRCSNKLGQLFLERGMHSVVSRNQVRGPGTNAVLLSSRAKRAHDAWVVGKPEVIIAAKRQQCFITHSHPHALGTTQGLTLAIQSLGAARIELGGKVVHVVIVAGGLVRNLMTGARSRITLHWWPLGCFTNDCKVYKSG